MHSISLEEFLELKLAWEPHTYHKEGTYCIYQDLAKQQFTIREIIHAIRYHKEFLSREKYEQSTDSRIREDHMLHYINCIEYGFRKNINEWRGSSNEQVHRDTYENASIMNDDEILSFLKDNPITLHDDFINTISDGNHRVCCMIGRLLRNEKYIPLYRKNNVNINYSPKETLPVVGYREECSLTRLTSIMDDIQDSHFTLIDIGSNYGYFSTNIALKNPNAFVMSFEGSFGTGNSSNNAEESEGIKTHINTINTHRIFNNQVSPNLFTPQLLEDMLAKNIVFDNMLLLSVFHWMVFREYKNQATINQITELFAKLLQFSQTVYLELPEANQPTSISPIYDNYNSLPNYLSYLKNTRFPSLTYKLLTVSEWYGQRELYKISHNTAGK